MATKAGKATAKKATAKKAPARKSATKKAARRMQEKHFLPPWVVIGKHIDAAIVGVDPAFKACTVAYFDAASGWVELAYEAGGARTVRRTHFNNIVIEAAG